MSKTQSARRSDRPVAQGAAGESLTPSENVLASVHAVSNLISRAFYDEIASKWQLSLPEWRILMTLAHQPGASAAEITDLWGMEKMAVSRAARRLEETGRVNRTLDGTDRRRYTLELTEAGRELYAQVEPGASARYREITAVLDRAERAVLQKALTKLIGHIGTLRP